MKLSNKSPKAVGGPRKTIRKEKLTDKIIKEINKEFDLPQLDKITPEFIKVIKMNTIVTLINSELGADKAVFNLSDIRTFNNNERVAIAKDMKKVSKKVNKFVKEDRILDKKTRYIGLAVSTGGTRRIDFLDLKTIEDRKKAYEECWMPFSYSCTHDVTVFNMPIQNNKLLGVTAFFYNNISSNEENYQTFKKYLNELRNNNKEYEDIIVNFVKDNIEVSAAVLLEPMKKPLVGKYDVRTTRPYGIAFKEPQPEKLAKMIEMWEQQVED